MITIQFFLNSEKNNALKLQQAISNLPVIGHLPVHLAIQKIIISLEAVEYLKVYVVIQGIIKKY